MSKLKERLKLAEEALSGPQSAALPGATPASEAGGPSDDRPHTPRTGPGAMLAGVAAMNEQDAKIRDLSSRLEQWVGAQPAKKIDPSLVDESEFANRDESTFHGAKWEEFKASLTGGNVQPVLVRTKPNGRYELAFGHRRTRACRELGIQVLAVIVDGLSDLELYEVMDMENHGREDLSPYEQGRHFLRALDKGLYPSARQLAAARKRDVSVVTRYLTIARLPQAILDAFPQRTQIQKRWGEPLAEVVQKDPDGVLVRAAAIAARKPGVSAKQVFDHLVQTPKAASATRTIADAGGRAVAHVHVRGKKIELDLPGIVINEKLISQLESVLRKVAGH